MTIGEGSVIGAGSVVTRNIPAGSSPSVTPAACSGRYPRTTVYTKNKRAFDPEGASILKSCKENDKYYLTCERNWVYFTLISVAGFWGAYTYLLRGNIFCNAQTGNVVLMGLALGSAQWGEGLYYLVPISAYILGAFVSELVPNPIKHRFFVRWDTVLIFVEMVAVLILGLIPESAPVQISQVIINFIASMQYNTFRQAEGVAVATTFVTNHIRQVGIGLAKELHHRKSGDKSTAKSGPDTPECFFSSHLAR